jgi:hypothetical protein
MPTARSDQSRDLIGRVEGILVFPHPHDVPASRIQSGIDLVVTLDVPGELRAPVVGVRARNGSMNRAPVPEAAIDEDSNLCPGEHDVRSDWTATESPDRVVLPEAEAHPV